MAAGMEAIADIDDEINECELDETKEIERHAELDNNTYL